MRTAVPPHVPPQSFSCDLEAGGLPDSPALTSFRIRINEAAQKYVAATATPVSMRVAPRGDAKPSRLDAAAHSIARPAQYVPSEPLFCLDTLVVPHAVRKALERAVHFEGVRGQVFRVWGLQAIEPFPKSALNFHGPSGNGKTLAAHGLAKAMGRRILCVGYADIESMYHGEGPKNVQAIFRAAAEANAVLFIDEADSLLSKRLTNVTQGSEQAINSMRSQILISLDGFPGTVVFATNLMGNYDGAFMTRIRHLHFPLPDAAARTEILTRHLPPSLPLAIDVNPESLAALADGFSGREIKEMVVQSAIAAAIEGQGSVALRHFADVASSLRSGWSGAAPANTDINPGTPRSPAEPAAHGQADGWMTGDRGGA